jgi:hypothetical protein
MSDDFITILDNCDGTFTVSDPTGEYDDETVDCEHEAQDVAEEMSDATGLEIKKG